MREAIADKLQRENRLDYSARDIIVTSGAKHAIFNALSVTVEQGHEVVIPAPFWVSYPNMSRSCARAVVINGVSKSYAMTGWRIGYAAGPSDVIAAMDKVPERQRRRRDGKGAQLLYYHADPARHRRRQRDAAPRVAALSERFISIR